MYNDCHFSSGTDVMRPTLLCLGTVVEWIVLLDISWHLFYFIFHEFTLISQIKWMVCVFGVLSEERALSSVFGQNPEYTPRVPTITWATQSYSHFSNRIRLLDYPKWLADFELTLYFRLLRSLGSFWDNLATLLISTNKTFSSNAKHVSVDLEQFC